MEKADWMSEEAYKSAVARGAFRQPRPFDVLTWRQLVGRGLVGFAIVTTVLAATFAAIFGLGLLSNTLAASNLLPWTLTWSVDAIKHGFMALLAISVTVLITMSFVGPLLRGLSQFLVEVGIWALRRLDRKP